MRTLPAGVLPYARLAARPGDLIEVDPPHEIRRALPRTIDDSVDPEFATRLTIHSPATFVLALERGRALGHSVLTSDGTLLADLSIEPGVLPENSHEHSALRRRDIPALHHVDGEVTVLSAYGGADNYFHWMFEVLPRIAILRREAVPMRRVLVNGLSLPYQSETLRLAGISSVIDAREHPYVSASSLIVPSLPGIMGDPTAASCEFLRALFPVRLVTRRRRLFISRAGAKARRLSNEDELFGVLAPLGFEPVTLERLSVQEQANLFASADCVVAPHGAGLTNIVFCDAGTKVIELFSPRYVNGCYWGVANHVGLEYWYLLGEGSRLSLREQHTGAGDDYRVDAVRLSSLLRVAGIG